MPRHTNCPQEMFEKLPGIAEGLDGELHQVRRLGIVGFLTSLEVHKTWVYSYDPMTSNKLL